MQMGDRKAYHNMPREARGCVEYIENYIGAQIKWIGNSDPTNKSIRR